MKRKGLTHGRNRKPSKGGSDGGMETGEQGMLRDRKAQGSLRSVMQGFRARLPGSITNNLCGVTQVTQHLRVPGNYCAQCPANNLLVVSVSIVAARPTLRLMLSLHPLLKTCTPAIPSQGLLPGHIIILPISEFEIFVVSSPSRVGFPNWL